MDTATMERKIVVDIIQTIYYSVVVASDLLTLWRFDLMNTVQFFPTKKSALMAVGSLSDTSKMPGKSWGINAARCITGKKLAEIADSICSMCYAERGFYSMYPNVKRAQDTRLELFNADAGAWVGAMVKLVASESFFRWFDSGDVQNFAMLDSIVRVARATPNTRHWLATRERGIVKAWLDAGNAWPENLVCRISATYFDEIPANKLTPWSSMAHKGAPNAAAWNCPAPTQGGSCGDCRACWSPSVSLVTYHAH
jgi:hypothetical protein